MFTGRMLFLTPNQQCQSTEGTHSARQKIGKCEEVTQHYRESDKEKARSYLGVEKVAVIQMCATFNTTNDRNIIRSIITAMGVRT